MTPAEYARQIDREEFAAESRAALERALAYSRQRREEEMTRVVYGCRVARTPIRKKRRASRSLSTVQTVESAPPPPPKPRKEPNTERPPAKPKAVKSIRPPAPPKEPRPPKTVKPARAYARCYTFNGESLTLKQWAERTGIAYGTIRTRALRGWSIERILSVSVGSWESAVKCTAEFYTCAGKTMTLLGWSRETGIKKTTLDARLRKGWSIERALTEPARSRHPYENSEAQRC